MNFFLNNSVGMSIMRQDHDTQPVRIKWCCEWDSKSPKIRSADVVVLTHIGGGLHPLWDGGMHWGNGVGKLPLHGLQAWLGCRGWWPVGICNVMAGHSVFNMSNDQDTGKLLGLTTVKTNSDLWVNVRVLIDVLSLKRTWTVTDGSATP